jgi:hypothetical protein
MSSHCFLEAALQHRKIQGPVDPHGDQTDEERAAGLQLLQEPDALLREREGVLRGVGLRSGRRGEGPGSLARGLRQGREHGVGEPADAGAFHETGRGELHVQIAQEPAVELHA